MINLFKLLPLSVQIGIVSGVIAAMGLAYGMWHHAIYKSGEDACEAKHALISQEQKDKANAEIVKVGERYAPIHEKLRQSPVYLRPVSPLVGGAIGGLPNPAHRHH